MQSLAEGRTPHRTRAPGAGECLAFRTPPMLNGQLRTDNIVLWNFAAYHSGLAIALAPNQGLAARYPSDRVSSGSVICIM